MKAFPLAKFGKNMKANNDYNILKHIKYTKSASSVGGAWAHVHYSENRYIKGKNIRHLCCFICLFQVIKQLLRENSLLKNSDISRRNRYDLKKPSILSGTRFAIYKGTKSTCCAP